MRLTVIGTRVEVALSKRNLLSLLHKVDADWSHATLEKDEEDGFLVVVAEQDEAHYTHEGRREEERGRAGILHPETEAFVVANQACNSVSPEGNCKLPYGHKGFCNS